MKDRHWQRWWWKLAGLAAVFSFGCPVIGQAPKIAVTTFTYKQVDDLEIKLDVHRAADDHIRPVTVWIHGGALINGGREGIGKAGRDLLKAGYCVVSIDYRLAPESDMPEIYSDLEDAFRWIRKHGREKFNGDVSKIAVLGGSAGGHLTLSAGFRVDPKPDVLVPFWGYGDLIGPWLSEPSPHPRHQSRVLTDAEMNALENGPPVANARDRKGDGGAYYQTCRARGIWPVKVSGGLDPKKEPDKFFPFMASKNVTPDYPPTLLIHGTDDTDVPHEQSEIMAKEFEKHGVSYRLISLKNGEHGLGGADPKEIEAAFAAVLPFIAKYVPPPEIPE
ncbi:MAG: alpha/beta hydrolase [Verrucomicrobiales bacterium]|nr:alpha/beta hydrolase [Verrucomicrobiales bacterium]